MAEQESESIEERVRLNHDHPEGLGGNAAEKRAFAEALRALLDEVTRTGASPEELAELTASVRQSTEILQRSRAEPLDAAPGGFTGMETFHDRSPIVGLANPIAPPAVFEHFEDEQCLRGSVEFGHMFEGAPGLVHGGFLAALLDEALGGVTRYSGNPGMTGEYTLRYHRPTRIKTPLTFEARFDRSEGRKIFVSAELRDGEDVTVSATGLFISVDSSKFEAFFQARRERIGD